MMVMKFEMVEDLVRGIVRRADELLFNLFSQAHVHSPFASIGQHPKKYTVQHDTRQFGPYPPTL